MANGKEIDFGIVVGAVADENSAKDAVNKLAKSALSTLKDGYIPVPAELKVPIKGASKELLKAQEKVVDQWDKTFAKGFSTSKKDMNELVDIYMEFKRLAKEQLKTSSGPVKKITALMGNQIQEYSNQRNTNRVKRIAKTNSGYQLKMKNPKSIADYYMEQLRHAKQELLMCAFFDSKNNFLGDVVISKGAVNYSYVSPRDIFRYAFDYEAVMFILLHNHPSGDPIPSEDDLRVTKRIEKGAQLLQLELVDHIIIGDNTYFSFKENELIN